MVSKYSGQCACGAIRYSVAGEPLVVAQCHCDDCRRLSGTGHSIGAMFANDMVVIDGKTSTFSYTSSLGSEVTKAFCPSCGSPVYGKNSRAPDYITLPLGTMNDAHQLEVEVVVFKSRETHWDQLPKGVAVFAEQPDWQPSE